MSPGGDGEEGMLTSHGGQIEDAAQPVLNSILPRGAQLCPPFPSHHLLLWGLDQA